MAGCSRVNFADSLTGCQMEPCLSKGRSVEWPDRCAVIGFWPILGGLPHLQFQTGPQLSWEARAVFPKGRKLNVMAYVMWKKSEGPIRLHNGKIIRTID